MLKSWSVTNFKSIVSSGELSLAPVTVFAGLNSSGKSSFLQSILMIAQTLSSRTFARALLPNGSLIQLGRFEDMLHRGASSQSITVAFELTFPQENTDKVYSEDDLDEDIFFIEENGSPAHSIHILATFSSASSQNNRPASDALGMLLDQLALQVTPSISIQKDDIWYGSFEFSLLRFNEDAFNEFSKHITPNFTRLIPHPSEKNHYVGYFHSNPEDDESTDSEAEGTGSEKIVWGPYIISLSHFLPNDLLRKFNIREEQEERLKLALLYLSSPRIHSSDDVGIPEDLLPAEVDLDRPLPEDFKRLVQEHFPEEFAVVGFPYETILDLGKWLRDLEKAFDKERSQAVERTCKKIIIQDFPRIITESNRDVEGLEVVSNNLHALNLDNAIKQIADFFGSRVRYLGPLRNDPQASQRFAPGGELGDVGTKGEYAATVYDAHMHTVIEWYHPVHNQIERGPLHTALDEWLRYLAIAKEVHVTEAGQSGFSWQVVHGKNQEPLPLSSVGVGVSQILPLLVMGLLSPAHTLLIVEQPELHLHPRMQARLGDFFIGLAKCQKQCLIETHSENLVNELRYHIVQGDSQSVDDSLIYFVSQDEQGAAQFIPIEISQQGNILNWPEGFFDESMLQEDRITAASLKKRAKGDN